MTMELVRSELAPVLYPMSTFCPEAADVFMPAFSPIATVAVLANAPEPIAIAFVPTAADWKPIAMAASSLAVASTPAASALIPVAPSLL
ncbi:hypothetical protein FQZ97_1170710 [compost metagenome]